MQAGAGRDHAHIQKARTDVTERVLLVSYGSNPQKVQIVSAAEPDSLAEVQQLVFQSR